MAGSEFSEDTGRQWKESLRPLSPGRILDKEDTVKRKSSRSNSIASNRRTRSRSGSPSRLLAKTVSSRAKERDAIRFEYKKPAKKIVPVARSRAKSVSPSREIPEKKITRASSMPKDDDSGNGTDSDRTPLTWAAPSVFSWSGTPDREYSAASHLRSKSSTTETSKNIHVSEQKISNERTESQRKQSFIPTKPQNDERMVKLNTNSQRNEIKISKNSNNKEKNETQKVNDITVKERKLEDWNKYPKQDDIKPTLENEIQIPVKNYRSPRSAASLPTERREGIKPCFEKKKRRKSLSTYSKTSSASRSFGGCVIS